MKGLWTLADQVLASLSNVLLTIVIAREASPDGLGAFGAAFAVYLIMTGVSRAVASEPLLVRFSAHDRQAGAAEHRAASRASAGAALALGLAGLAALLAVSALTGGTLGAVFAALAWSLPALLVKDALRFVFLAAGRQSAAMAGDLTWVLAQVVTVGWVQAHGPRDVQWYVLAWGLSAAAGAVQGAFHARCPPSLARVPGWLRAHRDLLPGYVIDFAARSGGRQVTMLAVGWFGGLAALGAIRAAEVLFSALNVVLQAGHLATIPSAVAAHRRGRLRRAVLRLGVVLVGASFLYGCGTLLVPPALGTALAGETWELARPVLVAEIALYAGIAAVTAVTVGLRAAGDARRSALVRVGVVPFSIAAGVAGALVAGAPGAVIGLAAVNWLALPVWIRQFRAVSSGSRDAAGAVPASG
ncbi:hypothetical protein GCM10022224_002410 [Nonomuraea antimicrobica]|uniref:Membrane protein involved in the export of O-antigen and teichoic acid n=1 Tax=Nonomuraea antimicrobica TaxID=561173 RepID=A0ABP7AY98_9ACTN